MGSSLRPYDEALLRRAFDVARRSRAAGDHPFGSALADGEGNLIMEQGNGFTSEGGDRTAHAERLLASRAARAYDVAFLARCTLYTSAEPCAMCAGAIYWGGIGRVVYGFPEERLHVLTGNHPEIAAFLALQPFMEGDEITVGTAIHIEHRAASGIGAKVRAEATLESYDGRFYTVRVTARDDTQEIGRGTVGRAVVRVGQFLEKMKSTRP